MVDVIVVCLWVVTGCGTLLVLAGVVGRCPRPLALGALGVAELATLVAVGADAVGLARGWQTPEFATHVGYLLTVPLLVPAGFALTYKKIDRAGLFILGVATLIAAIMIVRQVQTLGLTFGRLNG